MFNSAILDVTIGILFVFLLVSTICSAIREGIESWLKTRAAFLEHAIRELLHDSAGKGLAKSLFEHPLIYSLYLGQYTPRDGSEKPHAWQSGGNLPSYIPSKSFVAALLDITARGPSTDAASSDPAIGPLSFEALRESVTNLENPRVQRALLVAIDSAEGDIRRLRRNVEAWYDGAMERASGWYKRSTQWTIFGIALVVVTALNVNTLTIAEHLYRDPTLRGAVVASAEKASGTLTYEQAAKDLDQLRLPIGWSNGWGTPSDDSALGSDDEYDCSWIWNDFLHPIFGLFITALAATMGAPFWFDVLNRVMVLRSTIKPKKEDEPSAPGPSAGGTATTVSLPPPAISAQISPPISPQISPPGAGAPAPHEHLEGCSIPIDAATADEDLPPARGGVA